MSNIDKVSNSAHAIAGGAAIGNAIFNRDDQNKKETLQAIFIFYILFGGFIGTWLYLKNFVVRFKQMKGLDFLSHWFLPPISAFGGAAFWAAVVLLGMENRNPATGYNWWQWTLLLLVPTIIWGGFSAWCFQHLERINIKNQAGQLVNSAANAFWMQAGVLALAAVIWSFTRYGQPM